MATETHAAEGAEQAAGMPQLDFSTFPNQIFWLVITLVVIYVILTKIALPRIASVLADRAGTISNDIAAAEDLRNKAVEAETAYDKALFDARAEAQKIIADAKTDIQKDLDVATSHAEAEIAAKSAESEARIAEIRDGAIDSVREVATDVAKDIVAMLGQKADAKTIKAAIEQRIK
jgi:F-type H+-transporting ATPase subunit b